MLALALFIGAQLVELPTPPPAPVYVPEHRFVVDGDLGETLWVRLPLAEPAPTPSVRVLVSAGGESVELAGKTKGWYDGRLSIGIPRARLGPLARHDGVLSVQAWVMDPDGAWRVTGTQVVRSRAVRRADATRLDLMLALTPGTSRTKARRFVGAPEVVRGQEDWYDQNRLVYDAADRFVRWDPMGC